MRDLQDVWWILAEALGAPPCHVLQREERAVGRNEHVELAVGDNAYTRGSVKDSWHFTRCQLSEYLMLRETDYAKPFRDCDLLTVSCDLGDPSPEVALEGFVNTGSGLQASHSRPTGAWMASRTTVKL